MAQEKIQIRFSVLTEQVEEGWKLKPLAEHYGIPVSRMRDILKSADLRIRSFRGPQVELVDDTEEPTLNPSTIVESVKDTNEVSTEELPTTEEKGSDFDLDESDLEENWNLNNAGSGDTITEEDNNNLTPNYTF